jgi:hypothetical protein
VAAAVPSARRLVSELRTRGDEARARAGEPHVCSCGHELRYSGEGRHRIFWPADGSPADPVLERECPACGTALPA